MVKEHIQTHKLDVIKKIIEEKVDLIKIPLKNLKAYKIKKLFINSKKKPSLDLIQQLKSRDFDSEDSLWFFYKKKKVKYFAKNIRRLHLGFRRQYVTRNLVKLRRKITAWRKRLRVRKQTYRFLKKMKKQYFFRPQMKTPTFYHRYIRKIVGYLNSKRRRIRRVRRKLIIKKLYHNLPNGNPYYRFKHKEHTGCIVVFRETKNNFIITVTNDKGEVKCLYNAGKVGAKGAKKSMPFTAEECAKKVGLYLKQKKIRYITLIVKSRMKRKLKSAVRKLITYKIRGRRALSRVPVPHNGIRGKKPPRK